MVRRAIEAMQDAPERPYSVGDLAAIAGVSVRSLQQAFQRSVHMSPMAYLREVRLVRAHDCLLSAHSPDVTVAAVAHRWGFTHLGRFAIVYRTRFGVSPSTTLREGDCDSA